jgi:O-antigen/teichoic acid export membrane protein
MKLAKKPLEASHAAEALTERPAPFVSRPLVYGTAIPAVMILNALVGLLLPAIMTPLQFGEYALVVTLFQYGLIADIGTGQLIDRSIPAALGRRQAERAEWIGEQLLWVRGYIAVVLALGAGAVLIVMGSRGALPFRLDEALLSGAAGLLYMTALGPGFIYRAHSERWRYAMAACVLSLGLVIARPLGLVLGGITGCFLALVLWYLAFTAIYYAKMPPRSVTRPTVRQSLAFIVEGLPLFSAAFIWAFYLTANRWLGARLMSPMEFGHFAFATNAYSLLVGAFSAFSAFYYPRIARRLAAESPRAVSQTIARDCVLLTLGTGVLFALGIVVAEPLLTYIYPRYLAAANALRILFAAVPAMALASWLLPLSLSAGRRPWVDGLIVYPAATAILFFAVWELSGHLGSDGVAAASVVAALPLVAMQLIQLVHAEVVSVRAAARLLAAAAVVSLALGTLSWVMR